MELAGMMGISYDKENYRIRTPADSFCTAAASGMLKVGDSSVNIRKSLILSHIAVCILPLFMTLFVVASCFAGLMMYAASGNHVMAESSFQFNVVSNTIKTAVFHGIRHREDVSHYAWVMEIMDPLQTYVALEKDGNLIYSYGNEKYISEARALDETGIRRELDDRQGNSSYSMTDGDRYYYLDKEIIRNETYHLYTIAHHPQARSDAAIEKAFRAMSRFILLALGAFILLTSYLFSRFIIGRILSPLKELEQGAGEIRKGNLSVHLVHHRRDEFSPAIEAFNMMAWRLKRSLEEREEEEEKRKELIASISHDIRTPLTSIKAYVEGLEDHVASTPAMQERYLQVIHKKADVLERMVEQLLLLTKMDIGEKALPLETVDLGSLTSEFLEENRVNWEKNGAEFTFHAEENVSVAGSPLLIERIVENLISNSIKYKTDDVVHIEVDVRKGGTEAILSVKDDGPGVPKESLGRLKEAFYRTDKARSRTENGSGLGLSIVARAAELMKGKVEFKNRMPHGLEVILTLPLEVKNGKTDTDSGR
jgi:signal transduction histidine kinase